jgi:hypothetical protein
MEFCSQENLKLILTNVHYAVSSEKNGKRKAEGSSSLPGKSQARELLFTDMSLLWPDIRGLSEKYPAILNISRTGRMPWCNLAASQRTPYCASVNSHPPVGLVSRQWDAVDWACVLCDRRIHKSPPSQRRFWFGKSQKSQEAKSG